jgi:hypothetical protein
LASAVDVTVGARERKCDSQENAQMDEELDLAPGYRQESCTIIDETHQAACATDTPDQGMPDRIMEDVAGCSLRIKQDRRDGRTGTYLGFERRGRLNSR